jgi:hypothetical protein
MVEEAVTASEPVEVPERKEKFWPLKRPVFDMEKRVVVESPTVEELMAKRVRSVLEAWALSEKVAKGEVVPKATLLPK